jgi:hypothetical protein
MELEDITRKEDNFDDIQYLPKRHFFLKGCGVLLVVTIVLAVAWELAEIPKNWYEMTYAGSRQPTGKAPRSPLSLREGTQVDPSKVIGTSGSAGATEATEATEREAIQEELRDVAAVVNHPNAADLVGQRVVVHVPIESDSRVTYWVGPPDNQLLVVLHRDVRGGEARMASEPSTHRIGELEAGEVATIAGTIQRVPKREQDRFSWDLTASQRKEVEARGVYLLADNLRVDESPAPAQN